MRSIISLLNSSTRKNKPKEVSKLYKKWLRYLKRNKLFDEYMIYMDFRYKKVGTYPTAEDYDELAELVKTFNKYDYIDVGKTFISVNWYNEFIEFVRDSVRWWDFQTKIKYLQ